MSFLRIGLVGLACVSSAVNSGAANDFAIETHVYFGGDAEPVESYLTIFHGDKIYDLRTAPDQSTTVFDCKTRNFQIARFDPAIQSLIASDQLIRFSTSLQARAKESRDPLLLFAVAPSFEHDFDSATKRLTLKSPLWDYVVDVRTTDDTDLLSRYREFADWFTYLNSVFRPLPPGLRLELNRILHQHRALPKHVSVRVRQAGHEMIHHSEHKWIQPLGPRELEAIASWASQKGKLRKVSFIEYHAAIRPKVGR